MNSAKDETVERPKKVGMLPPARIVALRSEAPGNGPASIRTALQEILIDAVDLQLELGRSCIGGSPSSPERHAMFDRCHRIQRAARGMLSPEMQVPADEATRQITGGYLDDILEQIASFRELMALDAAYNVHKSDEALRVIGAAAETLGTRITSYLAVRAMVG